MHMKKTGHKFNFDFNNIRILDNESSYFKRLVSEMIFISKFNSVNRIQDTQNLKSVLRNFMCSFYYNILLLPVYFIFHIL